MDNVVVLDWGSNTFKAGNTNVFPSEDEPREVTPAAVRESSGLGEDGSPSHSGDDEFAAGGIIPVVERGVVKSWEGFETILHYLLYDQLGWELGEEGSMLMAEPLFTSKPERETLTQLMFEQFNVSGFFLCDAPVLSLYAIGKISGCVIDIGHGKTDIATVVEGQLQQSNAVRLPAGGGDLDAYLGRLLAQRGQPALPRVQLQALKEKLAVVVDSREEALSELERESLLEEHRLPDGQKIVVGAEGDLLGEALLQPSLMGIDSPPLAEAAFIACMSHPDPATRKACLESLLPCGGGSCIRGLGGRLLRELRSMSPPSLQPSTCSVPDYMPDHTLKYATWMGGAVLSKVVFQQNQHITKMEYDESGPAIVHRKCA